MNYYQAQYYNEALLHFGVKGMKWGVRRKRIASAVKKSAKTYGNFQKERLKTLGNSYIHPIMTSRALSNNMKNDKLRTKLRKSLYLTGNEYKSINRDVKKLAADAKLKRVDRKISRLKKKREKQSQKVVEQLSKNGFAMGRQYNKPFNTNSKIKQFEVKRASMKAGDSRRTTRLKVKRQPLKDYVNAAESRIYLNPPPQSDIKKYKKAKESLRHIDKKIKNQYKRQKKKRQ